MPLPPPRRGGSRAATPPSGNKSEWIAKEGERRPPGRGDRPSPSGAYRGMCAFGTPRRPYERYGFDSRGGFRDSADDSNGIGDPRCCSGPCKSTKGSTQSTLTLPPPVQGYRAEPV